jgi:adenylate cyclase class IV
MREIEVKARLQDVDSFLNEAAKLGVTFGEPFIQDDIIYETSTPKLHL